jgi:hypothetical protein
LVGHLPYALVTNGLEDLHDPDERFSETCKERKVDRCQGEEAAFKMSRKYKTKRKSQMDAQVAYLCKLLVHATDQLYSMALERTCVRPYGPDDPRAFEWMSKIRPGDMVVEKTSFRLNPERLGRILAIEESKNLYWLVLADGRVVSWSNCSFVRIPDLRHWRGLPMKKSGDPDPDTEDWG